MKHFLELIMIVKHTSNTVRKSLQSILPFVDYWTIFVSDEKIGEFIKEETKDKEGRLLITHLEDSLKDKNKMLEMTRERGGKFCKFTIILDENYIVPDGKNLLKILRKNKENTFSLSVINGNIIRYSTCIFKTNFKPLFKYEIDPILQYKSTKYINYFDTGIGIIDTCESTNKVKFSPPNIDSPDSRTTYLLGYHNFCSKDYDKAKKYLLERVGMKGIVEELFLSYYTLGLISEQEGNYVEQFYVQASRIDPERAEPLYKMACHNYTKNDIDTAYSLVKKAYTLGVYTRPVLYPTEYTIYLSDIPYLYANICAKLGKKDECKTVIKSAMTNARNFAHTPKRLNEFQNILYSLSEEETITVKKTSEPIVVFHTENKVIPFIVGLCEALARRNWHVVVFSNIEEKEEVNGVIYKPTTTYTSYIKEYYIDSLVVIQHSSNLVYQPNIARVYLLLLDKIPSGNSFQTHAEKFKGILCLSEWQRQKFCKEYQFPVELTKTINYTVNPLQHKSVKKTPFRFVVNSKELKYVLSIIPKIKERWDKTTLVIVGDRTKNIRKTIGNNDYITVKSSSEWKDELSKAEVWLNLTTDEESHSFSVLDVFVSRTLCVCMDRGCMKELLNKTGVLIEKIEEIIPKLEVVLENESVKNQLLNKGEEYVNAHTYDSLAEEWEDDILL